MQARPSQKGSGGWIVAAVATSSVLLALAACEGGIGSATSGATGGDMGVTPGGAQDMSIAREIIEQGGIPTVDHFRAEGLFSEHDLPFDGEPCEQLLCPRAAATWTDPVGGIEPRILAQIGFATNLDAAGFERRPLNLAVAVDISGSMDGEKEAAVREALHTMVDQLGPEDRLAVVAFDDAAELRAAPALMTPAERDAMHGVVDGLQARGSTNIEAGLKLAYDQVAPESGAAGVEDRVMLFTDALPNVGATDIGSFVGMARYFSAAGIGLSVFGVGLDLGAELAQEVSEVRGGNYFFLADSAAIETVFDDEFDYIVNPLAYDFEVELEAASGLEFDTAYGAPLDQPGPGIDFGASSLFLSSRGGGIGITLRSASLDELPAEGPRELGTFGVSYLPVGADEPVETELTVFWSGGAVIAEQQTAADALGVYKMAALLDEYLALLAAARYCQGAVDQAQALADIAAAGARLQEVATHLGDAPLAAEADLLDGLATAVLGGTANCWNGYY